MFWLGWLDSNQRNAGVKVLCLTDLATSQCGDALKGVKWGGRRACVPLEKMGWVNGFEPSASRATIWRSNQLSYTHRIIQVARPKGLEPLAHCLEGSCSIRLSYGRTLRKFVGAGDGNRTHMASLEGWSSTTELHLHGAHIRCLINLPHPAEKVKSVFGGQACAGPGIGGGRAARRDESLLRGGCESLRRAFAKRRVSCYNIIGGICAFLSKRSCVKQKGAFWKNRAAPRLRRAFCCHREVAHGAHRAKRRAG